jgi:rhodanese-related sulfurtransferase
MQDMSVFFAQHYLMSTAVVVILILLAILEFTRLRRYRFRLPPAALIQLINKDKAVVIDIRPQEKYRLGHIINALTLSSKELKDNTKKLDKYKSRPIIIVCENGVESQQLAAWLIKQGYHCYSLAGGLRRWSEASMPLIKE